MRLRGENLTCIRGERRVFAGLNFEVGGGETLAVTGRNGSGKSSLLRMLAGLIPVAAGEISFADPHPPLAAPHPPRAAPHPNPLPVSTGRGNAPASASATLQSGAENGSPADQGSLAEQAHYLGHRDALKPQLTVLENLCFWRDFLAKPGADKAGDAKADDALARAGLGDLAHLPAAFLSAGQRRRLSIARLMAVTRPVWLLDEPSSALDDAGQAMLVGAMSGHLSAGGLIVAATHMPLGLAQVRQLRLGDAA